jgi:DNA-binding NarL/FixJ family response regulator
MASTSETILRSVHPSRDGSLRLLADGYQVKEIANRLGVAKGTVYNTMSGVYGKLGVRRVTPAVLEAVRRGIITL